MFDVHTSCSGQKGSFSLVPRLFIQYGGGKETWYPLNVVKNQFSLRGSGSCTMHSRLDDAILCTISIQSSQVLLTLAPHKCCPMPWKFWEHLNYCWERALLEKGCFSVAIYRQCVFSDPPFCFCLTTYKLGLVSASIVLVIAPLINSISSPVSNYLESRMSMLWLYHLKAELQQIS